MLAMNDGLYIGPAGWSYADWNGIVYPARKPRGFDPLEYLSSYFNLIEINSTFYRLPTRQTCESWARRVSHRTDFKFAVKAYQGFTHAATPEMGEIDTFKKAIEPIGESGRLAAVLVQYPWSFRDAPAARRRVGQLVADLSPFECAVEVRHGSWARPDAQSFFRDHDICMCGIDQPVIGDSLPPNVSVPRERFAYYRLHGRNYAEWFRAESNRDSRYDYSYSSGELEPWVRRIEKQVGQSGNVAVVLNNHFQGQAVANALELKAAFSGRRETAPPGIIARFPRLRRVLEADADASAPEAPGQLSLFEQDENQNDGATDNDR